MTVICIKCGKLQGRSFYRGYKLSDDACSCGGKLTPARRAKNDFSRHQTLEEMQKQETKNVK
jgi:hypothetical protein